MLVVECIPFKGFKEKIAITKKYNNYSSLNERIFMRNLTFRTSINDPFNRIK